MGKKPTRKTITNLSCEELQEMIGEKIEHSGKLKEIGSLYFYTNKYGIVSIRIRFFKEGVFVNVKAVYKKNGKIIFEL